MPEGSQRCSRTKMVLPLRVWLSGQAGESLSAQLAHTIDISHIGCRLGGLRTELPPGETIALQRGQHKASFRVIWSKHLAGNEHQAGIEALDYGKNIWAVELPTSPFVARVPSSTAPGTHKVIPTAPLVPEVSASTRGATPKVIPLIAALLLAAHSRVRWGLSVGLLVLGLALGLYHYGEAFYDSGRAAIQFPVPAPPSAADLARLAPRPNSMPGLLTRTLGPSASRVQVAETPVGHVVFPLAPDDSIRGKVRLQIVIAANGVVKQIHALSGKQPLAEAAAQAVRFWRYSSFLGSERFTERETSVTVSFVGNDAVSLEFPASNAHVQAN